MGGVNITTGGGGITTGGGVKTGTIATIAGGGAMGATMMGATTSAYAPDADIALNKMNPIIGLVLMSHLHNEWIN
jgi:hypothetical protein